MMATEEKQSRSRGGRRSSSSSRRSGSKASKVNEVIDHQQQEQEEQQEVMKEAEQERQEEPEQEQQVRLSRKDRMKRRKIGLDSDLTEAERRVLRHNQRELYEKIQTDDGVGKVNNEEEKEDKEENKFLNLVENFRHENNELFNKVAYTREAVLDGENMDQIAKKFALTVDQMIQVPRYDPSRLVQKLKQKCTANNNMENSFFDWKLLGVEVGICYNALPSRVTFLSGPLHDSNCSITKRPKVARQARRSNKDDEEEAEEPEEVKGKADKDPDQLSAVERSMKVLKKCLKLRTQEVKAMKHNNLTTLLKQKKTKKGQPLSIDEETKAEAINYYEKCGGDVDAVQYLFNPKSFTQTVENIFHFSFLVKKSEAGIVIKDNILVQNTNCINSKNNIKEIIEAIDEVDDIEKHGNDDDDDGMDKENSTTTNSSNKNSSRGIFIRSFLEGHDDYPSARQSVISFNMRDWKNLVEAYDVKKGDLPHRKQGNKQPKNSTMSLSQNSATS